MNLHDGKIGLTREELEALCTRGFEIAEHTSYFMNGVTASCAGTTAGLYGWLSGLDAGINDVCVPIETEEQAHRFLAVMDSLVALHKALAVPAGKAR